MITSTVRKVTCATFALILLVPVAFADEGDYVHPGNENEGVEMGEVFSEPVFQSTGREPLRDQGPGNLGSGYVALACEGDSGQFGIDTDADGIADSIDQDDDCDRLQDSVESSSYTKSNSLRYDSDSDGNPYALDISPIGDAILRLSAVRIETDVGMDCSPETAPADPYFAQVKLYATPVTSTVFTSGLFPGITQSSHPHDKWVYTSSDFVSSGKSTITLDVPEDIRDFRYSNAFDLPQPQVFFNLFDHDSDGDGEIDINPSSGGAGSIRRSFYLYDLARVIESNPFETIVLDGWADGWHPGSAKVNIESYTNALRCAIDAALRATNDSDTLISVSDIQQCTS